MSNWQLSLLGRLVTLNTLNEKWKLKQLRLESLVLEFSIKICFSYFGATCIETTLGPNGEYFYLWPVGTTWPFFGQINNFYRNYLKGNYPTQCPVQLSRKRSWQPHFISCGIERYCTMTADAFPDIFNSCNSVGVATVYSTQLREVFQKSRNF